MATSAENGRLLIPWFLCYRLELDERAQTVMSCLALPPLLGSGVGSVQENC